MTESTDTDGKKSLHLSRPGRLELRKTVEAGQVRQSFSHGRTKAVTVEVKKKRTFARGASGRMAEIHQMPGAAAGADSEAVETGAGSGLTGEERAARERALLGAGPREAGAPPGDAGADVPQEPVAGAEPGEAAAAAEDRAVDGDKSRLDDEEARRLAQKEVRVGLTESRVKPLVAPSSPGQAPKPASPPDPTEERRPKRARPEGRKPGPGTRRQEPRRRAGKMTVTEALSDDRDERTRSLAAVRRQREREKQQARAALKESKKVIREVVVPETITVQELSNRMAERGADVIKILMNMGVMVTINQTIDADTAELVVAEFGHKIRRRAEADVEIGLGGDEDDPASMKPRAPVVTVMGHVDHGKTSLLDALRETDVAAREAGGITQHIGAYQVELGTGERITFLDTPGHEAFTAMRARGARATDIVVLVVAADDGIQPQTVEAIDHAKAAGVPIIVAVNKIDRPDADPTRVRNGLLQHEIVPEEMGGEVICVDVSALKKTNLDKLEEAIVLQAEVLELAANPDRPAQGVVVEAKVDRGRGPVATVLIQRGTLRIGDIMIAGSEWGRVRALADDRGGTVTEAGPSEPVEVLGLSGAPMAGDDFAVVENDVRAREITEFRARQVRQKTDRQGPHSSVEQFIAGIKKGELSELPAVIKADVQGSVEAIAAALQNLSTDEVAIQLLHTGVGGINESDITLAQASGALVVGFNVRANPQARAQAESRGIDIRYYSVIYDIIDDVKALLSGMLSPEVRETYIGNAEIREVFNITKTGKVAGCMITRGVVRRGAGVRLLRDDVVIHEGKLGTLKRFKDEVKEVKEGVECGMGFERYQNIRVGDVIECYETEEIARTL